MSLEDNKLISFATYLMLILPAAVVISPPFSNLLELILCILFLSSYELRNRFVESFKQPIVKFGFLFVILIVLSSFWSDASLEIKKEAIISWRKIILLPMVVSLINTSNLKDRLITTFIIFSTVIAVFSWCLYITEISFSKLPNEILRNHVTQTMVFFLSAFFSINLLIYKQNLSLKYKGFLIAALIILLSNSFIISTSRSGYLLGLVLTVFCGFFIGGKKSLIVTPALLLLMSLFLYLSPTANNQVKKAVSNIVEVESAEEYSSAGIRMVFWENTIKIVSPPTVLGSGLKSFESEYEKVILKQEASKTRTSWKSIVSSDPHNQYLLILVEQGLLGIFIFVIFIASFFYQKVDSYYRVLGLAVLCGWMATSLFNGHFSSSVEGRLVLLFSAAMLSMPISSGLRKPENTMVK